MDGPMLMSYDRIIVMFSGGKDSTACVLELLGLGVPKGKIELWHQKIDGEGEQFMDWPITTAYCEAFAKAMGIPIQFQWRQGGFYREMMRDGDPTAPVSFEAESIGMGIQLITMGGKGPVGTRLKFPQVSADLSVRFCSSSLKIDVADVALRNQKRFQGIRTLVVTGERAEESPGRAKYEVFEPHRSDLRNGKKYQRHIDHWRPVHKWFEKDVWAIIEKHNINVHPAYHLGFGRLSCRTCIFGSCNQWASCFEIDAKNVHEIAKYEVEFGKTIHRTKSVPDLVADGKPYQPTVQNYRMVQISKSKEYNEPIFLESWHLPAGAYGESDGPT